jgi:hypothetical protein
MFLMSMGWTQKNKAAMERRLAAQADRPTSEKGERAHSGIGQGGGEPLGIWSFAF